MATFSLSEHVHRRFNPLAGEWVLVSPHRTRRPWQGQIEAPPPESRAPYDPGCYLCPGNERAGGIRNPDYPETFVFDNDFAALRDDGSRETVVRPSLLRAEPERGVCRVICFSPRHDLTLPEMDLSAVRRVVDLWTDQTAELGGRPDIRHVQIFENKGAVMGCSNPHPHGQIWAQETVPDLPAREGSNQATYYAERGTTLLGEYLHLELECEERLVYANCDFIVLVPFWAFWPFETMIVSRRAHASLLDLSDDERTGFADAIRQLTIRYDNLFNTSFPYSAGIHQAPMDGDAHPEWHLHMHFFPPLLRSATVKKFMVGYEMLAMPQRDISPETAAERLRACPDRHYRAACG